MRACHRTLLTRHGSEAAPSHSADDFIGEHPFKTCRSRKGSDFTLAAAVSSGPRFPRRARVSARGPPCADGLGRVLLLQETPSRVKLIDPKALKVVASINLAVEGRGEIARAWSDELLVRQLAGDVRIPARSTIHAVLDRPRPGQTPRPAAPARGRNLAVTRHQSQRFVVRRSRASSSSATAATAIRSPSPTMPSCCCAKP